MTDKDKMQFEEWYADNAFNYEESPIGSRDCGLQRKSWQAAKESGSKELEAAKQRVAELEAERNYYWTAESAAKRIEALEKELAAYQAQCHGELTECPTCKNDIAKCVRLNGTEELTKREAAAEQRGFESAQSAGFTEDDIAAARHQGFEEGNQRITELEVQLSRRELYFANELKKERQAGRDELLKEQLAAKLCASCGFYDNCPLYDDEGGLCKDYVRPLPPTDKKG